MAEAAHGFYFRRAPLDVEGLGGSDSRFADFANVTNLIGNVVSLYGGGIMADLATTLSIEDCYDLLEIASVNAYNRQVLSKGRNSA